MEETCAGMERQDNYWNTEDKRKRRIKLKKSMNFFDKQIR